jgi:hypothetical protein
VQDTLAKKPNKFKGTRPPYRNFAKKRRPPYNPQRKRNELSISGTNAAAPVATNLAPPAAPSNETKE